MEFLLFLKVLMAKASWGVGADPGMSVMEERAYKKIVGL